MAKFAFILAAVALVASGASTKKTTTLRQTCVDRNGQSMTEGSSWNEGVNGCVQLRCTNGTAVGTDNCSCSYPDQTVGQSSDVWSSIPNCQSCLCNQGQVTCDTILNCIPVSASVVPSATASASASVTSTDSVTIVAPGTGTTCPGPDGHTLKVTDRYLEGCQACVCTAAGLACTGMVVCPGATATATSAPTPPGSCFSGYAGFIQSQASDKYYPDGYTYVENCNTCTCRQGTITCHYSCDNTVTATDDTVTVTITDEPTETEEEVDDELAALDCDVDVGIVLNGDPYTSECGAECVCVDGELQCQECPGATTEPEPTQTEDGSCPDLEGNTVANGATVDSEECTKCTCLNGEFKCTKVCNRDCKPTNGDIVPHGKTTTSACLNCKCNDATLTCENSCANQVCTVPGSKTTLKRNTSKTVNKCLWCKCSSTALISCRDKCPTDTSCMCDGRILKSGKSLATSKCETCTCNNGSLKCKDTC